MKKIFFVSSIFIMAGLAACTKQEVKDVKEPLVASDTTPPKGGREDDDKGTVIHFVRSSVDLPLQNASIIMTNNTDSLVAVTDSLGQGTIQLFTRGKYRLRISYPGYHSLDTLVDITDSLTYRTTTLY